MGFWTKYFSTILRGTSALSFKQRWNARKIVRKLGQAEDIVFAKLPKEIEKDHRVTNAMKDLKTALKDEDIGIKALDNLMLETEFQEENLHEAISHFIRSVGSLKVTEQKHLQIMRELLQHIKEVLQKATLMEREEYKDVESIIIAADKDHTTLRMTITSRFKEFTRESFLERLAVRSETKQIANCINYLNKAVNDLERISRIKTTTGKEIKDAEDIMQNIGEQVKKAFYELDQLKKRCFLWVSKILYDLFLIEDVTQKYVGKHELPAIVIGQEKLEIGKMIKEISDDFKIIAQGFRIQIKRLEKNIAELGAVQRFVSR